MTYGAWVNPGDETHRYGVHNNGGGGRAEVVYVVYVVIIKSRKYSAASSVQRKMFVAGDLS